MRFSFGLRGMTCRYRNRKTSAPLCVMVRRMNRFISGSITGRGRENGQCGAGELFPTTAWRCSRRVSLVSSSEGAARSRREVLVSLQTQGGRVQRKWRMNRRRWRSMGPSSSIRRPGRRPRDGSIRDWKANKRAVKGVICAKRGKNLQLFIPTDISKAEMLRTPSRQNDTRSIKN